MQLVGCHGPFVPCWLLNNGDDDDEIFNTAGLIGDRKIDNKYTN